MKNNNQETARVSIRRVMAVGVAALYITMIVSVAIGPISIGYTDSVMALIPSFLYHDGLVTESSQLIINHIRLPRTLLAAAIGAILALCGTVLQGLFRNPLAEPSVIGVSAGAAFGAALAIVLFAGLGQDYPLLLAIGTLPLFSFLGGSISTFLVYRLGTSHYGTSVTTMLLAGVAMSALTGAGLSLMNYLADDQGLRTLSLWTMGALTGANWSGVALAALTLALLFSCFFFDADRLNALLLGEPEAQHLGINVQALKKRLILLSAAGVGVTVALVGIIGFIGLIVPHLVRMITGPNHRALLPVAMIAGALLLLVADIIARSIIPPVDLPVGIVTALLGSPFFIWLLVKHRGEMS